MSGVTFRYDCGPFMISQAEIGTPYLSIHLRSSDVVLRVIYWPPKAENTSPDEYISLRVGVEESEATTYMSLDQAVTMRDALTAALNEAVAHALPDALKVSA